MEGLIVLVVLVLVGGVVILPIASFVRAGRAVRDTENLRHKVASLEFELRRLTRENCDLLKEEELRRLYNSKILAGFAGATADAFALFTRFETKLEQFNGNLPRSVVEMAKDWRTDRMLRHLEALLLVADPSHTFILSGTGDVIDPDDNIAAIGSGGAYAKSAATALMENTTLPAREIVEKAMAIAGKICIYTNNSVIYEELG